MHPNLRFLQQMLRELAEFERKEVKPRNIGVNNHFIESVPDFAGSFATILHPTPGLNYYRLSWGVGPRTIAPVGEIYLEASAADKIAFRIRLLRSQDRGWTIDATGPLRDIDKIEPYRDMLLFARSVHALDGGLELKPTEARIMTSLFASFFKHHADGGAAVNTKPSPGTP